MLAQLLLTAITRSAAGAARHIDDPGWSHDEVLAREIRTHRQAIALYESKANGADLQLRIFAQRILPQLQQHLAMLEALKSENLHARR